MSSQQSNPIFRKEALDHLSTPEQLDQLLQVVNRKSWIPITTIGGLMAVVILWSIVGQIPVTVEGTGLLVYPRQVVSFQLPSSGQIIALNLTVGDLLRKGQVLGRINQPALQQNLDQERVRLAELRARNLRVVPLRNERVDLQKQANERERRVLAQRIESITRTAASQKAKNESYVRNQRESLVKLRESKLAMDQNFKARYEGYQTLASEGLVSKEVVMNARQDYINNQVEVSNLDLQMRETELQELRSEDSYRQQMDLVADLQTQLRELEIKAREISQQQLETDSDTAIRIQEMERTIARYEEDLKTKSEIVSDYSGRVLEVTASVGQIVTAGQRLGAIETEDPSGKLQTAAYFELSDGKKIEPGMEVRITPVTVERERYGSMIGKVLTVSPFPVTTDAIANVIGNVETAETLSRGGNKIEVFVELSTDSTSSTGYAWTSGRGPDVKITAGTTSGVRATVEHRRPITFVIPILRRWSGG